MNKRQERRLDFEKQEFLLPNSGFWLGARCRSNPRKLPPTLTKASGGADMSRRFWIGLVLTIPILVMTMGHLIPGFHLEHFISGMLPSLHRVHNFR